MDFTIPKEIQDYLSVLDRFIETDIKPLEEADDNIRFFDHRREYARTDFENQGLPRADWEALLSHSRLSTPHAKAQPLGQLFWPTMSALAFF